MKRIAFCFDGTWNTIDSAYPTNVARIAQSIARHDTAGNPQIIHYDEGVGTTRTSQLTGGIFGHGLIDNITEAYHFLVLNYEPGDQIFVFGFSRGAFTARSFVGLLRNSGIMGRRSLANIREAVRLYISRDENSSPNSEAARQFRFENCPSICLPGDLEWRRAAHPEAKEVEASELQVRYLGVWDTVGALGIPAHIRFFRFMNRRYKFHDTTLSSVVERARHAVSADERRRAFEPALWSNLDELNQTAGREIYEQQIFPGTHGGVGGGGPVRGLSDGALDWVLRGARDQGLAFDLDLQSPVFQLQPDPRAQIFNETGKSDWSWKDRLTGVGLADRRFPGIDQRDIHRSLVRRFKVEPDQLPERKRYRPQSLKDFWEVLEKQNLQPVVQTKAGADDRSLRAPDRVRKYTIKAGDSLERIAASEMDGGPDEELVFEHNRKIGKLYDPSELYAGLQIEIPVYTKRGPPA